MRATIESERVFKGVQAVNVLSGYPMRAVLLNEAGTTVWRCDHRHTSREVALRCAESERRRWIRDGKGRA